MGTAIFCISMHVRIVPFVIVLCTMCKTSRFVYWISRVSVNDDIKIGIVVFSEINYIIRKSYFLSNHKLY